MNKNNLKRYASVAMSTVKRYLFGFDYKHDIKHLTHEITNLCNSKCEMCNIWANKPNERELTTDQVKSFYSDPALSNLEDCILTGGELFMRNDIVEVVKTIWDINGKTNITLSTNGILADKILGVAKSLYDLGIPITYGISIDGIGEDHNSRRRVDNNFEIIDQQLIPGLKKISQHKPSLINIAIGHCLDDYGYNTFDDVKKYCEKKQIGFMTQLIEDFDYYLPEKKQNKTEGDWDQLHFVKKGFEGKNRLMKKEIYDKKEGEYINMIEKLNPTVHHFRLINVLKGNESKYECTSFRNFFLLKYDGAVTPCLRFATTSLGNLHDKSISQILDSHQRHEALDEISKCEGCLNTWCTDWSMEKNALPFKNEVYIWLKKKLFN